MSDPDGWKIAVRTKIGIESKIRGEDKKSNELYQKEKVLAVLVNKLIPKNAMIKAAMVIKPISAEKTEIIS